MSYAGLLTYCKLKHLLLKIRELVTGNKKPRLARFFNLNQSSTNQQSQLLRQFQDDQPTQRTP